MFYMGKMFILILLKKKHLLNPRKINNRIISQKTQINFFEKVNK